MIRKLLLFLAFCLALPATAGAQGDDMAYCAQLSALYRRYLGNTGEGRQFPDVSASVAMDECQKGNTAAGIPVLEKKLRDGRFTLPKRSVGRIPKGRNHFLPSEAGEVSAVIQPTEGS